MQWKLLAALVFILASLSFVTIAGRLAWEEGYDNGYESGKDETLEMLGWPTSQDRGPLEADPTIGD